MQVSSPKYGVVPKTSIIREVLNGKEVTKFEKDGADIYATVILPLKSEDKIFGAVEIRLRFRPKMSLKRLLLTATAILQFLTEIPGT